MKKNMKILTAVLTLACAVSQITAFFPGTTDDPAAGAAGGMFTGAAIGGLAGGRRGAGYGMLAGGILGATSAAARRDDNRKRDYYDRRRDDRDYQDRKYNKKYSKRQRIEDLERENAELRKQNAQYDTTDNQMVDPQS